MLLNNMAIAHWECHQFIKAEQAFLQLACLSALATSSLIPTTTWSLGDKDHVQAHHDEPNLVETEETLLVRFTVERMLWNTTMMRIFASAFGARAA